jgi:glutamate N-acetyltransferase/amino-acid N-acetyltransferase
MKNISVRGFKAAGVSAGLKKSGHKDLGMIFSQHPANVAGLFTKNRVQAAPVLIDKERITSGVCQAIIVNSGNANCCTGDQGINDARTMAKLAASELEIPEELVLVASTGVIGKPLPIKKIGRAIPDLVEALHPEGIDDLAKAIMTTDTVPKKASRKIELDGNWFTIAGVVKGAGMIRPDMATMLCFVCTDADVSAKTLKTTLIEAANRSFNRITIDGDTSTNDTILILANGLSEVIILDPEHQHVFQDALNEILLDLAKQLVSDGEGVTKLVEIIVQGAMSDADARKIGDTIANSPLVKTAFFGEDANWGRIVAAAGRSGATINPDKIDIYFDDAQMVKNGMGSGKKAETSATSVLKKPEFTVTVDFNCGDGSASILTCDFSLEYVKVNAAYRS